MGVTDEDSHHIPRRSQEAVECRRLRQVWAPEDEVPKRDPREEGVDEDGLPFVCQAVAGDPEPFDLQAGRQFERPLLQLADRMPVLAFGRAPGGAGSCQLSEVL
jgi:hypothetical protein